MDPETLSLNEFLAKCEEIRHENEEVSWVLLNIKEEETLPLSSGSGNLDEMVHALQDDTLALGYARIRPKDDYSVRYKYFALCWSPEACPRMLKSKAPYFKAKLTDSLVGKYSLDLLATTRDELADENVFSLIKKASGADYDSGGGDQTTESVPVDAPKKKFSKPAPRGGRRRLV